MDDPFDTHEAIAQLQATNTRGQYQGVRTSTADKLEAVLALFREYKWGLKDFIIAWTGAKSSHDVHLDSNAFASKQHSAGRSGTGTYNE